jgi:hypothetical protein
VRQRPWRSRTATSVDRQRPSELKFQTGPCRDFSAGAEFLLGTPRFAHRTSAKGTAGSCRRAAVGDLFRNNRGAMIRSSVIRPRSVCLPRCGFFRGWSLPLGPAASVVYQVPGLSGFVARRAALVAYHMPGFPGSRPCARYGAWRVGGRGRQAIREPIISGWFAGPRTSGAGRSSRPPAGTAWRRATALVSKRTD